MLKKKVKNAWLKALRSDKYEQCVDTLQSKGKYCCLGVAKACGLGYKRPNEELLTVDFLPTHVQIRLSSMNDIEKLSFKQIANWIEKNL